MPGDDMSLCKIYFCDANSISIKDTIFCVYIDIGYPLKRAGCLMNLLWIKLDVVFQFVLYISFRANVFIDRSGKRIKGNYILIRTKKASENYCSKYVENMWTSQPYFVTRARKGMEKLCALLSPWEENPPVTAGFPSKNVRKCWALIFCC